MKSVGVYEARTRFGKLVEEARQGETIQLTRNGEVVAQLTPPASQQTARQAAEYLLSRDWTFGGSIVETIRKEREKRM